MKSRKVFVLGLDGVPFRLLQPWIDQGKLPTFKMLIDNGVSGNLESTIPPLTIPAWPAMMTGKNPGKLGIFSFLQRAKEDYSSQSANLSWSTWNPIWNVISEAGKRAFIVNVPSTTTPDNDFNGVLIPGVMLGGGKEFAYPSKIQDELEKRGYRRSLRGIDVLGKDKFLTEVSKIINERHNLVLDLIRDKWDFFMAVFYYTDPVLHSFTKYINQEHPDYEENKKYSQTVLKIFQRIDRYISEILEALPSETNLFIVSDHGMDIHYKHIDLNAWLVNEGFMALKDEKENNNPVTRDSFKSLLRSHPWLRDLYYRLTNFSTIGSLKDKIRESIPKTNRGWEQVDWSNTKAYSIGWNSVFINLKGREPYGAVEKNTEYERIRERLTERLKKLYDSQHNEFVIQNVWKKEEIYKGPYLDMLPDLVIEPIGDNSKYVAHNAEAAPGNSIFAPSKLSAAHTKCGIFIGYGLDIKENVKIKNTRIFDIVPNVLHALNVPIPEDVDGRVLKEIFQEDSPLYRKPVEYQKPKEHKPVETKQYSAEEEETVKQRLKDLGYL